MERQDSLELSPPRVGSISGLGSSATQASLATLSSVLPPAVAAAGAEPIRMVLAGPPGGGKGTQADLIKKRWGAEHLSTGEILREEVKNDTELGRQAKEYMDRGELVPDDIMLRLVRSRVEKHDSFILDGFPRSLPQAEGLDQMLADLQKPLTAVVMLDVDEEVIVKRLLARGRPDDTEDVIRNRLKVYQQQTLPAIAHYRQQGLVESVPAAGAMDLTKELVHHRIENRLNKMVTLPAPISSSSLLEAPSTPGFSAQELLIQIDRLAEQGKAPYATSWTDQQRADLTQATKALLTSAIEARSAITLPELTKAAKLDIDQEVQAAELSPQLQKAGLVAMAIGGLSVGLGLWQSSPILGAVGVAVLASGALTSALHWTGAERHTQNAKALSGARDLLEGWSVTTPPPQAQP